MILLTGATGFVGAYIMKELVSRGHRVRAIRRSSITPFYIPESITSQVEWIEGNVLDIVALSDAMQNVTAVIHSAGKVSFARRDQKELYHTNIEGTANVVNAAIENNVPRIVHISSVAALGRKTDGANVTEKKKWEESKVNTHYSISKYHAEMEVWRGIGEGLQAVIVNPSTVLGFGDWNSTSCRIFKNAYDEFPWYTKGVNGFVDVEDVAAVVVQLMESNLSNERYILNSENWSFQQLLNTMADGLNKKRPPNHATPLLGALAWRLEKLKSMFNGKPALLSKESAKIAQSVTHFDNSKILSALPNFKFTPLQTSIERACRKYLQHIS